MKKILFILFAWFFLIGTANAATWYTVRKDSNGVISNVSGFSTAAGVTFFVITEGSGISVYADNYIGPSGSGVSQLQAGTSGYVVVYNSSTRAYGVSTISGVSITDSTITDAKLTGTITKEIATTSPITGRSKDITLPLGTYTTLPISAVTGIFVSAVSDASVAPTSGASCVLGSPDKAGYDVVFLLINQTSIAGTSIYVAFASGDNIASADTILAGTSKFIMTGTTDAQQIWCHSTGVSKWFVRTTGAPSIDWD